MILTTSNVYDKITVIENYKIIQKDQVIESIVHQIEKEP